MKAFQEDLEPVALPGQVLRLEPDDTLRRVSAVEPFPLLGPFDEGAITAGSTTSDVEMTELELRQNQLGQFRVHPISPVQVEVKQTGQQDFRYETANQRAVLAMPVKGSLTSLFVLGDDLPFFDIINPNTYDLQRSRIAYSGFKFILEADKVPTGQVDGTPISVPIKMLEQQTQSRDGGGGATQGRAVASRERRR